ncbi:hypothetical protein Tco_1307977 [Tanacetum coccineum]
MALGYQNPLYLIQAQKKQNMLYDGKVLSKDHEPPSVYDSKETLRLVDERQSKMKKLGSEIKQSTIQNEEYSSDTPKKILARGFLNEVKNQLVTLQRTLKSKMTLTATNLNSDVQIESLTSGLSERFLKESSDVDNVNKDIDDIGQ